jgi:hypothetical protein
MTTQRGVLFRSHFRFTASVFLFSATMCLCQTPAPSVVCNNGDGSFDAEFRTGINVHVGAMKTGGLAVRACEAKLNWGKQELLVTTGASQVDLDGFGADLGDGVSVATFPIKKLDADCCMEYAIYSLQQPPHLLRTITGGEFFSASDRDLDGRVAIWTQDAAAANGLDNLVLSELDFVPTVVFRFAHGQLTDVSAEFQPYFDKQIGQIRADIDAQHLQEFKGSDGRLTTTPSMSPGQWRRLRDVKIKVLEIVCAYLYSGRERSAWRSLSEMWPSVDVDRIRTALVNAREHGIRKQADGTSSSDAHKGRKHARVFDVASHLGPGSRSEVVPPRAILLQRPPLSVIAQQGPSEPELFLDLVLDGAGKVRSAALAGKTTWVDPELVNAARNWKFIPAFKDGRPIASQLKLAVSLRQ